MCLLWIIYIFFDHVCIYYIRVFFIFWFDLKVGYEGQLLNKMILNNTVVLRYLNFIISVFG